MGVLMSAFEAIPKPMPADELKEAAEALRAAVSTATATVSTPDGAVEVTAGPGNAIVGLGFGRAAYRYSPERLGILVVDTVREATARATATIAESARTATRGRLDLAGMLGGALPDVRPPAADDAPEPPEADGGPAGETLRRLTRDAQEQLRGYAELRTTLATLSATARSDDGGVAAEVRAGGELLALHIAADQFRHEPAALAAIVHSTVMTASARAAMLMAERVQELTGPRIDVRGLVERYQSDGADEAADDQRR